MFTAWVVFHVVVCVALVLVVLMQSSKGDGLAGTALGGGAGGLSGAVFGGRGAGSFLSKATTVLAVLFMVNSAALAFMSGRDRATGQDITGTAESVVTREAQREMEQQQQVQEQRRADSLAEVLDQSVTPLQDTTLAPETTGGQDTAPGGQ